MSENNESEYKRCYTCGKYLLAEDTYKNKYCSLACSSIFSQCQNCGSFFNSKEGYSENYCSSDCADNSDTSVENQ